MTIHMHSHLAQGLRDVLCHKRTQDYITTLIFDQLPTPIPLTPLREIYCVSRKSKLLPGCNNVQINIIV